MPRSGWCQRTSASNPTSVSSASPIRWLEVELELIALDRIAEVVLDRHPFDQPVAERGVEGLEAAAAELAGAVHRGDRVAQQLLRGLVPVLADSPPRRSL